MLKKESLKLGFLNASEHQESKFLQTCSFHKVIRSIEFFKYKIFLNDEKNTNRKGHTEI